MEWNEFAKRIKVGRVSSEERRLKWIRGNAYALPSYTPVERQKQTLFQQIT